MVKRAAYPHPKILLEIDSEAAEGFADGLTRRARTTEEGHR